MAILQRVEEGQDLVSLRVGERIVRALHAGRLALMALDRFLFGELRFGDTCLLASRPFEPTLQLPILRDKLAIGKERRSFFVPPLPGVGLAVAAEEFSGVLHCQSGDCSQERPSRFLRR